MKGKILPFIIGLLVGAIIATGGFLIYQKNNKHQGPREMNGQRPQMMQKQDGDTPPALPDGEQQNGEASSDAQTQNSAETTNS